MGQNIQLKIEIEHVIDKLVWMGMWKWNWIEL